MVHSQTAAEIPYSHHAFRWVPKIPFLKRGFSSLAIEEIAVNALPARITYLQLLKA